MLSTRKAIVCVFLILVTYQVCVVLLFGHDKDSIQANHREIFNEPLRENPLPAGLTRGVTTNTDAYSHFHCVGDNFLGSAWKYRSCQYRNICWDSSGKGEWFLHSPSDKQKALQDDFSAKLEGYQFSRISTLPAAAQNWTKPPLVSAMVGIYPPLSSKWSPSIMDEPQKDTVMIKQQMAILPILVANPDNKLPTTLTLLMDYLLPLYNLVGMFGWRSQSIAVHVLNEDQLSSEYLSRLQQVLNQWMGYQLWQPHNATTRGAITCFVHGAAGTGMLSVTGESRRGLHPRDYHWERLPHQRTNVGRGALFWDFTRHILSKVPVQPAQNMHGDSRLQIVLAGLQGSGPIASTLDNHLLLKTIEGLNQSFIRVQSIRTLDDNTEQDWIGIASTTHVWISSANETWTWPSMFLPRGSTLILLYDENAKLKKSNIASRGDFDFWNNVAHLKVHWLSIRHDEQALLDSILRLIRHQAHKALPMSTGSSGANDETVTFNGINVQLVRRRPEHARLHCVGENFQDSAPDYRSCQFENLCFSTEKKAFVQFSNTNDTLGRNQRNGTIPFGPGDRISTDPNSALVQIGQSIRLASGTPWAPIQMELDNFKYFYQLPSNVLWIPYYPEQPNVNNPGHLLWDYWLPIYTLVDMFGQHDKHMLLTNIDQNCVSYHEQPSCYKLTTKFLPLLGVHPSTFVNTYNSRLVVSNKPPQSEQIVCASRGLAGIGMLTDHGFKKHGQLVDDYKGPYNHGRGINFWRFRNFMLFHMGMGLPSPSTNHMPPPYKITFSVLSSNNPNRRRDFETQIQAIRKVFRDETNVIVQKVVLADLSLTEQIRVVKGSNIFISVIGGSTSTAMFLERNACLVLYYNDKDDFVKGKSNNMPVMMDWDFWNHASYIRVHWLPLQPMDSVHGMQILTRLLESELEAYRYSNLEK